MLTPSLLYNFLRCPHRVWRDLYGPQEEKDPEANKFMELLWKKGLQHEDKVTEKLGDFLDLSEGSLEERRQKTLEAMKKGIPLIYQGVIEFENLRGIPDILKKLPDGTYIPVDIKSGMAHEGADEDEGKEGKPKKHYAVQLCLYVEVLRRLGFQKSHEARVIDITGKETVYELLSAQGPRTKQTWWELYEWVKDEVTKLIRKQIENTPALISECKNCVWYKSCKKWCEDENDLTCVNDVGRSARDTLCRDLKIKTVEELSMINVTEALSRKEKGFLDDFGEKRLTSAVNKAGVLTTTKKPVIKEPISFSKVPYELFLDIENDPTQEFVYLHGIYERSPSGERFFDFTARSISEEAEKEAWRQFWDYIRSLPKAQFVVYYYSHHEKTTYRKLQKKYQDLITEAELEGYFQGSDWVDLYKIIKSKTDWPMKSYSVKAIAQYLGFEWRDKTPSGALSIEWFNNYLETGDESIMQRILEYNEDDCKAMMVIKDKLVQLSNKTSDETL